VRICAISAPPPRCPLTVGARPCSSCTSGAQNRHPRPRPGTSLAVRALCPCPARARAPRTDGRAAARECIAQVVVEHWVFVLCRYVWSNAIGLHWTLSALRSRYAVCAHAPP
jgi:hypothetical protein